MAADLAKMLDQIRSGLTYRDLAAENNVSLGTIFNWLNADEATAELSARARSDSAESWLDKGLDVLSQALSKSGDIDASAAKAYAQECARRAAIRNAQYSDKQRVELHGTVSVSLRSDDADA